MLLFTLACWSLGGSKRPERVLDDCNAIMPLWSKFNCGAGYGLGDQAQRTLARDMPVDWKRCSLCGKFQSENQEPMKRCVGCYQRLGVSTFYCVRDRRGSEYCEKQLTCMAE